MRRGRSPNKNIPVNDFMLAGLLAFTILMGACSQQSKAPSIDESTRQTVMEWKAAIADEDSERAIDLAKELVGEPSAQPSDEALALCKRENIDPSYLTLDFNKYDYQYWRDAFFFQQKAREFTQDINTDDDMVRTLLVKVADHINDREPEEQYILWPYTIWQIQQGVCDRSAWVLCELAYQLGFDTMIIYLRDPGSNVSPHTVSELRKDGNVWLVDPYMNTMVEDKGVAQVAEDWLSKSRLWQNETRFHDAIENSIGWLPAYPQAYRPHNQELAGIVQAALGDEAPRFGERPTIRLQRYLRYLDEQDKQYPYNPWFYPFRLLAGQATLDQQRAQAASG